MSPPKLSVLSIVSILSAFETSQIGILLSVFHTDIDKCRFDYQFKSLFNYLFILLATWDLPFEPFSFFHFIWTSWRSIGNKILQLFVYMEMSSSHTHFLGGVWGSGILIFIYLLKILLEKFLLRYNWFIKLC